MISEVINNIKIEQIYLKYATIWQGLTIRRATVLLSRFYNFFILLTVTLRSVTYKIDCFKSRFMSVLMLPRRIVSKRYLYFSFYLLYCPVKLVIRNELNSFFYLF